MFLFIGQKCLLCLILLLTCIFIVFKFSTKYDKKLHFEYSSKVLKTTCSREVANLGPHQKVISYSFLNKDPGYSKGLNEIMKGVSIFYPDWKVRIYSSSQDILFLKSFMKNWNFVYFCDIDDLPAPIYTVRPYPFTMWRFAPLGDDQVDVFMSRDLDSEISRREFDAVSEWLNSTTKSLHIMRDHPHHRPLILAGMWGIRLKDENRENINQIKDQMFKESVYRVKKVTDQMLLEQFLWPEFEYDFLAHDSYFCDRFQGSSPFPTRREGKKFVGAAIFRNSSSKVREKCPAICRPKTHQDWEYC
ncbi:UNVERIFIED_CONTAM: hypothetical protein RMT77_005475 [Armadillidium vulgare]